MTDIEKDLRREFPEMESITLTGGRVFAKLNVKIEEGRLMENSQQRRASKEANDKRRVIIQNTAVVIAVASDIKPELIQQGLKPGCTIYLTDFNPVPDPRDPFGSEAPYSFKPEEVLEKLDIFDGNHFTYLLKEHHISGIQ